MLALPICEMTNSQVDVFLPCSMMEGTPDGGVAAFSKSGTFEQGFYVMLGKMVHAISPELKMTEAVKVFVSVGLIDRPGVVSMWAAVLAYLGRNGKEVKMWDLSAAFPNGFPTEAAMKGLYEDLKKEATRVA
jgi:hypothetical protein